MARIHGFLKKFLWRIQMDSPTWSQISNPVYPHFKEKKPKKPKTNKQKTKQTNKKI